MIKQTFFGLASVCVILTASVANAALDATFVFQGTVDDVAFIGGSFVVDPFDLYYLDVTNNEAVEIFTFNDLDFNGSWLQTATTTQDGTALLPSTFDSFVPGDQFEPDTFFAGNGTNPTTFGAVVDDATNLSAATVSHLGSPWIAVGATTTIGVFSVPVGSSPLSANNYLGGGGIVGSEVVPLTFGVAPPSNQAPVAGINGPFNVDINIDPLNILLDASSSTDDGNPSPPAELTYKWDLDNDGQYDDADTGTTATLAIADVTAQFGGLGVFTVGVEVSDSLLVSTASTTVTLTNSIPEPTTLGLAVLGLCGIVARRRRNS